MKSIITCLYCNENLTGQRRKFCSNSCKNGYHQTYSLQQERGTKRKIELINRRGGCCEECGYNKNLAALTFHHIDPTLKTFSMDLRSLSNRTMYIIEKEFENCMILCANCHIELHNPQRDWWAPLDSN